MALTLGNKIKEIYAHPIGKDIINKLLLQLNKPVWLADNFLAGNLSLGFIKKLAGKRLSPGFFDAVLNLLNSEPDRPEEAPVETARHWWKEAVFYQIYPRSFGTGNAVLRGILSKLDYLQALGVDALWLSPVYDSPNDDNGYDIRDYEKILAEFGDMDDMEALIKGIHQREMKLIMDLVVNHTSDEHPWFQAALNDENSPYRDFYFFRKSKEIPNNYTSFFSGPAWRYFPEQDVWALCLFSKKQMDLNWECEALRKEIHGMVKRWLERGVDGFRLDVINYISKPEGLPDGDPFIGALMGYTGIEHYFYGPRLHTYLKELRREAFEPYRAFSVGETPGVGIQMGRLLSDAYRRELDLIFSFDHLETPGKTRFEEYEYDLSYLKQFYIKHLNADKGHGWNTLFYNNHDNPRMISKIDPSGLFRETLAKLLAVLQLTLRGTPFLYQGDETGAVNQPFACIDELQDVESRGLYKELIKTMPAEAAFKKVLSGTRDHARVPLDWREIEKQFSEKGSVLEFYRELIQLRRLSPALIYGELEFDFIKHKYLFCYTRRLKNEQYYIEANMSRYPQKRKIPAQARLLMGNYTGKSERLRPYEANIYKVNHP